LAPDNPLVLAVLAEVYLDTNQYDEALATARQAVEIDPDSMEGHRSLAATYASMQKWEEANDEAQAAYILHPHFAPIMVTKGYFLSLADDAGSQKAVLDIALAQDPGYISALGQLAAYHEKREEYDKALEVCDQIVDLEPEFPDGYECRGDTYLARDVYDDALRNYDLAIDRDVESVGGYFGRGQVFLRQDDCEAARVEFEKVIELRLYSGPARAYVGYTELCEDEYTAAIESFQEAREMNPYYSFSSFGLGLAYLGEERYEDAETQFLAAIELDDDVHTYHLSLGDAQVELEKYDEAEAAYLRAVELEPEEISPYVSLGHFYLDRERYYEAEEQFEQALELDEESAPALVGAGVAYAMQERCCEATRVLNQARELDPDNFVADEIYNQCWDICRRENPPGPQGDPVDEGTAVAMAQNGVIASLGLSGNAAIAQFDTAGDGARVLSVGYLATFDPNTQPTEFANQLNQAVFASVEAFVRADSAPVYLSVEAFAIQGQDVVRQGGRAVHRVDAVDWWNKRISDAAFIGKLYSP
jgi:tetratricopeptide (TPR) repeat protein